MSTHDCFDQINEKLKPHNAKLACVIGVTEDLALVSRYIVATEKLDKTVRSKKPPSVAIAYCPFCGLHIEDQQ